MNIYLDNNATTRLDPRVKAAMMPLMETVYGNPSSIHAHGQQVRHAVDTARGRVASLINAEPEEIIFTSGGTESCNTAILGHCRVKGDRARILASRVEHPAVLRCVEYLASSGGAAVDWVDVTPDGVIDPDDLTRKMASGPTLVSVMTANNDVGALMPVSDVAAMAHAAGAVCHTDAVQAVGKIPVDVKRSDVDMLSCSAHKLHGPPGVGALYVKRGTRILPTLFGGHQEYRRRPGTENVAGIVGFGVACELAAAEMATRMAHVMSLKTRLENGLGQIDGIEIYGRHAPRLSGTCYVGVSGVEGETLQMALDLRGFSVSMGSACSSESRDPSHVLTAMGVSARDAVRAVRFSLGPENTEEEIDCVLGTLRKIIPTLRRG